MGPFEGRSIDWATAPRLLFWKLPLDGEAGQTFWSNRIFSPFSLLPHLERSPWLRGRVISRPTVRFLFQLTVISRPDYRHTRGPFAHPNSLILSNCSFITSHCCTLTKPNLISITMLPISKPTTIRLFGPPSWRILAKSAILSANTQFRSPTYSVLYPLPMV